MSNLIRLELPLANKIVNALFDSESLQILAINGQNGITVSVAQQFVDFYDEPNLFLKYSDEDKIVRKALEIFEYARFSLDKWKQAKLAKEKLFNAESFYQVNHRGVVATANSGNINYADTTNIINKKDINVQRADAENYTGAKLINRQATSQFNEDEIDLEKVWREDDAKETRPLSTKSNLFDIKIPEDLSKASISSVLTEKPSIGFVKPNLPQIEEDNAISYTNAGVVKNNSQTLVEGANTSIAYNESNDKNTNEALTVQTNSGKTVNVVVGKNFIHGDAQVKALNIQIKNFRDMFFSTFRPLFKEYWVGY